MNLILEEIPTPNYEAVYKVTEKHSRLTAIIALHNTILGPALGGIRIYPYPSFEAALEDVLRLSRGMTYKAAAAEIGLGGGKGVIIADPKKQKNERLLLAFAKAVDLLEGKYICAQDSGITAEDLMLIRQITPYVVGLKREKSSGDPSPFTAWGTLRGIQAVLRKIFGSEEIEGKTIAIQGLGSVGAYLAELLFWQGAKLIFSDMDLDKMHWLAERYDAEVCLPDEILRVPCDILSPSALGGVINEEVIPHLRCRAIAGCANNQLLKDTDADLLMDRGILYAPDFVISAGGLINVSKELGDEGYRASCSRLDVEQIYAKLLTIFSIAEERRCSTYHAALIFANERIKSGVGKPPLYMKEQKIQSILAP